MIMFQLQLKNQHYGFRGTTQLLDIYLIYLVILRIQPVPPDTTHSCYEIIDSNPYAVPHIPATVL